jgi:hypothetical protein
MNDVTCCRMFDGRLSVRYNGAEVALLPNRLLMTPEDVERAVVAAIMAHDDGQIEVTAREAAQDAHDETIRALSGW